MTTEAMNPVKCDLQTYSNLCTVLEKVLNSSATLKHFLARDIIIELHQLMMPLLQIMKVIQAPNTWQWFSCKFVGSYGVHNLLSKIISE